MEIWRQCVLTKNVCKQRMFAHRHLLHACRKKRTVSKWNERNGRAESNELAQHKILLNGEQMKWGESSVKFLMLYRMFLSTGKASLQLINNSAWCGSDCVYDGGRMKRKQTQGVTRKTNLEVKSQICMKYGPMCACVNTAASMKCGNLRYGWLTGGRQAELGEIGTCYLRQPGKSIPLLPHPCTPPSHGSSPHHFSKQQQSCRLAI